MRNVLAAGVRCDALMKKGLRLVEPSFLATVTVRCDALMKKGLRRNQRADLALPEEFDATP